jgi:hypothetical protein
LSSKISGIFLAANTAQQKENEAENKKDRNKSNHDETARVSTGAAATDGDHAGVLITPLADLRSPTRAVIWTLADDKMMTRRSAKKRKGRKLLKKAALKAVSAALTDGGSSPSSRVLQAPDDRSGNDGHPSFVRPLLPERAFLFVSLRKVLACSGFPHFSLFLTYSACAACTLIHCAFFFSLPISPIVSSLSCPPAVLGTHCVP